MLHTAGRLEGPTPSRLPARGPCASLSVAISLPLPWVCQRGPPLVGGGPCETPRRKAGREKPTLGLTVHLLRPVHLSSPGLGVGPRTGYAYRSCPAPCCRDLLGQRSSGPGPRQWRPCLLPLSSPQAGAQPAHSRMDLGRHCVLSLRWALREKVHGGGEPGVFGQRQHQGLEVSARGPEARGQRGGRQVDLRGGGWGARTLFVA